MSNELPNDPSWKHMCEQIDKELGVTAKPNRWTEPIPDEKMEPNFLNEPKLRKDWKHYEKQLDKKKPSKTPKKDRIALLGMRIKPKI